jgi:preprotein translocase subunit SecE
MMNKQVATKSNSRFDWIKWVILFALIGAGIWANYHYSQIDWALRFVGWIFLVALLLFLAVQTASGRAVWRFCKDARGEMRKVVWPTRPEVTQTTTIVVCMVVAMSLILWGLDSFLLWVVSLLTGQ